MTKIEWHVMSMTGFGHVEFGIENKKYVLEIKTLNSKQLDVSIKWPHHFRSKEIDVRNILSDIFNRGKIDFYLSIQKESDQAVPTINIPIAQAHIKQLNLLMESLAIERPNNLLEVIMRMPDIYTTQETELSENEWLVFSNHLQTCVQQVVMYRKKEGNVLAQDLYKHTREILIQLEEVEKMDQDRVLNYRKKLSEKLSALLSDVNFDKSRLEQEILYFAEKTDISEEKVRLKTNCEHFLESMSEKEPMGRKLGFISQEIGREINTIGSKCNDFNIQKRVIAMKESLEKIKEQCANIL